jgi:hypothetical protein
MTLVYSDSPLGALGMVDISDPANPQPMGAVMLGGEPTSVTVKGGKAFATVNTSESYTAPSGRIEIVDMASGAVEESCDLGGQPDSSVIARDGSFLVVAIENERDEDLDDGVIPQAPGGHVAIIPMDGAALDCAGMITADVSGLAEIAPDDPEPEFVDVNGAGEIAVTLQENNHIVILDSAGEVISHFSAGTVDLQGVDVDEEGALTFEAELTGIPREPDAVQWLDDNRLVTANEGDYEGGSRGFTVFTKTRRRHLRQRRVLRIRRRARRPLPGGALGQQGRRARGHGDRDLRRRDLHLPALRARLAGRRLSRHRRASRAGPAPALGHRAGGRGGDPRAQPARHRQRGRSRPRWRRARACDDLRVAGRRRGLPDARLRR